MIREACDGPLKGRDALGRRRPEEGRLDHDGASCKAALPASVSASVDDDRPVEQSTSGGGWGSTTRRSW